MEYKTVTLKEFQIVGITIRTTNEHDTAMKDIGVLWNKFYFDNIMEEIPQKVNEEIISLYTDYEKDFTKPYSVILGHKVNNNNFVPDGMASKTVPAAKYAVFHVEGQLPQELIKVWKWIWKSDLERTYTGDFEVYKKENEADIFVAVN
ncbi:MAG: hypothetical protein RI947_603 [Candidatus Parcubacteria bacterium]|jgi:predicted transcriptional regulator YdeE